MINAFGILNVYIAIAILAWLAFGLVPTHISCFSLIFTSCCRLIWTIIRYGDRMRAYVDIGFTNDTNN